MVNFVLNSCKIVVCGSLFICGQGRWDKRISEGYVCVVNDPRCGHKLMSPNQLLMGHDNAVGIIHQLKSFLSELDGIVIISGF